MTGSGTLADPYVIWDVNDLQAVKNDLGAYYELGCNIDALPTVGWNGGLGFDPVGETDCEIICRPNGDHSAVGAWTIFPADGIYWDKVDEAVSDDDATYIEATANGSRALLTFAAPAIPADASHIVLRLLRNRRRTAAPAAKERASILVGGSIHDHSQESTVPAGYSLSAQIWPINPKTGLPWTVDDINGIGPDALQAFGVQVPDASSSVRVTQVWLLIRYDRPFTGNFNGKNHTITGLSINRPAENHVGLFTLTNGALIQNFSLLTLNVTGRDYSGALAGESLNSHFRNIAANTLNITGQDFVGVLGFANAGLIQNLEITNANIIGDTCVGILAGDLATLCSNSSTQGNVTGNDMLGAFAGLIEIEQISNCHSAGRITTAFGSYIGGFTGWAGANAEISDCSASVDVDGNGTSDLIAGFIGYSGTAIIRRCFCIGSVYGFDGVAGFIGASAWGGGVTTIIENCYSRSSVHGVSDVAGFCNKNANWLTSTLIINNSYFAGSLICDAGDSPAEVAGFFYRKEIGNVNINACCWDIELSGINHSLYGTGKTTEEMNHRDIYIAVGWDLDTIWNISQVSTGLSTNITPASAVLNGLLDLTIINDAYPFLRAHNMTHLPCNCGFEWGETIALGNFTPVGSKNTGEGFNQVLAGLTPQTKYYFRARASSSPGPIHGGIGTFTTAVGIEVETLPATNITENSARIWGVVRKVPVTAMGRFDWGGSIEYGIETTWVPGLISDDMFYHDLNNLAEGRAYHFRAVAMGSSQVYGNDMTFTTRTPLGPVTLIQEELAHIMEVS